MSDKKKTFGFALTGPADEWFKAQLAESIRTLKIEHRDGKMISTWTIERFPTGLSKYVVRLVE